MKKTVLSLTLTIFAVCHVFPQCYFNAIQSHETVYTPKGTPVDALNYCPLSSADYSGALNFLNTFYPNVTLVENPTSQYNCYSYAFHLSEGSTNKVWINPGIGNSNLSKYWSDGSFVEVCDESNASKAFYFSGDHAALTTSSQAGKYQSKWGANALVIHLPNDAPYSSSNLKYYISTAISGSTAPLCSSTRTLSVADIPGATYTWSVSSSFLSIVSGQGTHQLTVQRNGSSQGQGWVEVEISTPCSAGPATSKRHNFWVGHALIDYVDIPTGSTVYPGTPFALRVFMQPDGQMVSHYNYRYEITGPGGYSSTELGSGFHTTSVPNTGFYFVEVYTQSECGWSTDFFPYSFYCAPGMAMFSVYPNPASATLTVAMGSEAERSGVPDKAALPTFKAVLYDGSGRQLRQGDSKEGVVQFDTRQLPNGTYFLHIHHNGEVEKRQVVIRH